MNKSGVLKVVVLLIFIILFVLFGVPEIKKALKNYNEYNEMVSTIEMLDSEIERIKSEVEIIRSEKVVATDEIDTTDVVSTINYLCSQDGVSFDSLRTYRLNSMEEVELLMSVDSLADAQKIGEKCGMADLHVVVEDFESFAKTVSSLPLDLISYTMIMPKDTVVVRILFV